MFEVPLDAPTSPPAPMPTPSPPAPMPTPSPTPIPTLPLPDFRRFHHGIALFGGWFPLTVEIGVLVLLVAVIGWRTRRWRLVWVPVSAAITTILVLTVRGYVDSQTLPSDPAPLRLWLWVGIALFTIAVTVLGWRTARWWRRGLSVLMIPIALLAVSLVANQWLGYYRTLPAAWDELTAGPLPDEVDANDLTALRNSAPASGKLVKVTIPDNVSGFKHRPEYVYLPPAWFAGASPPALPAVIMIAGEFDPPAEWVRSGNAVAVIDGYAREHGGQAPIFVFIDPGGVFNNDTECVNGPRGNAADHFTEEVRPYVISRFGASSAPGQWAVVGWSMGGACAIDLAVMHPDLFSTFEDIAGDRGPSSGDKAQTIDRLYGGNAAQWDAFDPRTVMARHGPYSGIVGWIEDAITPPTDQFRSMASAFKNRPQPIAPVGFGGHDEWHDNDQTGAAQDLCTAATAVHIPCAVHTLISFHTWPFAARAFSDALPWIATHIQTPPARAPT